MSDEDVARMTEQQLRELWAGDPDLQDCWPTADEYVKYRNHINAGLAIFHATHGEDL